MVVVEEPAPGAQRPPPEIEEGTAQATTEQKTSEATPPRKAQPAPVSARKPVPLAVPGHTGPGGQVGGRANGGGKGPKAGVRLSEDGTGSEASSQRPAAHTPIPKGRPLKKKPAEENSTLVSRLLAKMKRGDEKKHVALYLTPAEAVLVPDDSSEYLDMLPALAEAAFGVNKQIAFRNLEQLEQAWGESRRKLLEAGVAAGLMPEDVALSHESVTVAPARREGGGVFISVPKWVTASRNSSGGGVGSPHTPEVGGHRGRQARKSPRTPRMPSPAGKAGLLPPLEPTINSEGGAREGGGGGMGVSPREGEDPLMRASPAPPLVPTPPMGEPKPRPPRAVITEGGSGSGSRGADVGGGGADAALEAFHELAAVFGRPMDPHLAPLLGPVGAHVDAANSRVVRGSWEAPYLFDANVFSGRRPLPEGASSRLGDEYKKYTRAAVAALREGRVAVQLLATGGEVALPGGGDRLSLYNVDPYDLADAMRGGAGGAPDPVSYGGAGSLLRGLAFGPRHLLKLTQQVQKVVGGRGMDRMCVVLHVGPDTESAAVEDLVQRQFYGMRPENVLVVVQPQLPAYTYSDAAAGMVPDPGAGCALGGTGYAMRQLEWSDQAYVLSADGCERHFLRGSVLEYLEASGRDWLTSNRINDAYRYTDVVLDVDALALTLMTRQEMGACMSVEVEEVRKLPESGAGSPVVMQRPGGAGFSCELRESCMRLADVRHQVADVFEASGGPRVPRSTRRPLYFIPHLRTLLRRTSAMPPELVPEGRAFHVMQDMSDISMQPDAKCVALLGLEPLLCLEGAADLAEMMRVIRSMDSDAAFHQLAARLSSRQAPVAVRPHGVALRHRVVMLTRDNESSRKAFALIVPLLTPGLDSLRLVTGVERAGDIPIGQKLLASFVPAREHGLLEVCRDVVLLPQGPGVLAKSEVFKKYAGDTGATLLVVGSERGASRGNGSGNGVAGGGSGRGWAPMGLPLGSTALAMLSGTALSALVVKANSQVGAGYGAEAGSLMLGVDAAGGCLEALGLVLSLARRRDKCSVVRHEVVSAQEGERRKLDRLVFDLEERGLAMGKRVVKRVAEGHSWAEAVATCAASERVDVVAVAAPAAPGPVPPEVLEVAIKAWGAVLVAKPSQLT